MFVLYLIKGYMNILLNHDFLSQSPFNSISLTMTNLWRLGKFEQIKMYSLYDHESFFYSVSSCCQHILEYVRQVLDNIHTKAVCFLKVFCVVL